MQNDHFSPTRDEERLPEDGDTPAAPPLFEDDRTMPADYPTTDTDVDEGGKYYGGLADESGYRPNPESDDSRVMPLEADDDVN